MILSEEQTMVRDMARDFAARSLAPHSVEWESKGAIPVGVFSEMGSLGLMGMTVPEAHGGAETDFVSYALALMEIAGGDGAVSTVMSVNNSPCCAALLKEGTDLQKETFLVPLAKGEKIGAFCLTEPQAGSDASALKTRARKDGDHYIINGTKQFITSGRIGGVALVFAVTDPEAGKRGISCFIVPTDSEGYRVVSVENKLGQKASDTCQIAFEDVRVPAVNMLGAEGAGYKIALANLETGRIGIAAQSVGMASAALAHAVTYAKERVAFDKAIIEHQAVGFRLADMATKVEVARQMVLHAASLKDAGLPCLTEASMAKLFASEMAEEVCSGAIQTLGGNGYIADYPVEKIYRDVRVCQIYEGTSDIQKLVIARNLAAG
ncbi:acyl-CoA dehydrogenase family protein [uncultured Sneathiella sp.]|jgi:alkylation response protein AidB-like acyl-CoA dehydrogenase|uniref:acyl-CoA dehydrogenase family protein n=1 Tax=uncultured Sneathiella sp. TaxID=879315 RepID=UPI0030DBAF40|tara:strand:- start:18552 stop:19688 length:1137 start_codon:yes stop_codon:yes gene_type:complete